MNENLSYIVFTDFDGTISLNDIGDSMFQRFGDDAVCEEIFTMYRSEKVNARECWQKGCASVGSLTKEEFASFVNEQPIDKFFKPFVEFCQSKQIPLTVLSDGFDAYIDSVLGREGLGWLPRFSNTLQFNNDGTIEPLFPYSNGDCSRCANCKRNHMLTRSGDEHVIVYIGDGYSDRCPVQFADVVFAKGSLVRFCEMNNITFTRFETFADVLAKFRPMVEQKKLRKRRTAELARKKIFIME